MSMIRPRRDGGMSECSSPEEMVGKGRCVHVGGGNCEPMQIERIQRGMYQVEVNDSKLTVEGENEVISKFFNSMAKLPEDQQKKIEEFLKTE